MTILKKYKALIAVGGILVVLFNSFTNCSNNGMNALSNLDGKNSASSSAPPDMVQVNTMLLPAQAIKNANSNSNKSVNLNTTANRAIVAGSKGAYLAQLWPRGEVWFKFVPQDSVQQLPVIDDILKTNFMSLCKKFTSVQYPNGIKCIEETDSQKPLDGVHIFVHYGNFIPSRYSIVGKPTMQTTDSTLKTLDGQFFANSIVLGKTDLTLDSTNNFDVSSSHLILKLIGHSLGLQSEFNRADRDSFVSVPYSDGAFIKLGVGYTGNVSKNATQDSFDFTSIMMDPFTKKGMTLKAPSANDLVSCKDITAIFDQANLDKLIVDTANKSCANVGLATELSVNDQVLLQELYPQHNEAVSGVTLNSNTNSISGTNGCSCASPTDTSQYLFNWGADPTSTPSCHFNPVTPLCLNSYVMPENAVITIVDGSANSAGFICTKGTDNSYSWQVNSQSDIYCGSTSGGTSGNTGVGAIGAGATDPTAIPDFTTTNSDLCASSTYFPLVVDPNTDIKSTGFDASYLCADSNYIVTSKSYDPASNLYSWICSDSSGSAVTAPNCKGIPLVLVHTIREAQLKTKNSDGTFHGHGAIIVDDSHFLFNGTPLTDNTYAHGDADLYIAYNTVLNFKIKTDTGVAGTSGVVSVTGITLTDSPAVVSCDKTKTNPDGVVSEQSYFGCSSGKAITAPQISVHYSGNELKQ